VNRSQLREAVTTRTSRSDLADLVNDAINASIEEIARVHRWKAFIEEISLAISTDDLSKALPDRTQHVFEGRVIAVSEDDEDTSYAWPIEITAKNRVVKRFPDIQRLFAGIPVIGYVESGTLYFYPKASQDLTIKLTVYTMPDVLTDDTTQTPELYLDQAIIAAATRDVFASIEKFSSADYWDRRYLRELTVGIREDNNKYPELRGDPFSRINRGVPIEPYLDPFNRGET